MRDNGVRPAMIHRWESAIYPRADRLQRNWHFVRSTPTLRTRLIRIAAGFRSAEFPAYRVVRPVTPAIRWNCLFLFCPSGALDAVQAVSLREARKLRGALLIIVALPSGRTAPSELAIADALVEKDLAGFDFSAYRIALALVAEHSPKALVYLQNDSVFGPVVALDPMIEAAPWDLTGFIANPVLENHISSFAFVVRAVTPARLAALSPALPARRSYDRFTDVVAMQETRLARIAARHMSVGAYWNIIDAPPEPSLSGSISRRLLRRSISVPLDLRADPMLGIPLQLHRQGFPFIKRSLFSKFAGSVDAQEIAAMLRDQGWPAAES
jgi:hypothetical protein